MTIRSLMVGVLLLAAGCSTGATATTTGSTSSSVTSTTTVAVSTTRVVSGGVVPAEDPLSVAQTYGLVSPDGEYVGPVDSDGAPLVFEPIEGYGDFSKVDRFDVDTAEATRLLVECVNDQGFAVTLDPDGGIGFGSVSAEQNGLATAVYFACKAGLRLQAPEPLTSAQWEKVYAYEVALASCVAELGYSVSDPPSLDAYIDSQGDWSPYFDLPDSALLNLDLIRTCPQNPVGGYGAWNPGDPILPMP
jgi:hypothetical protein